MKKLLFVTAFLVLLFSCSSNEDEKTDNTLVNTSWMYQSANSIHTPKEYEDYENQHQLLNILKICPSLKYTVGEHKITNDKETIDLCKRNGHSNHIEASLLFNANSCIFKEKTYQHIQTVDSSIDESDYKFEGGSYIGTLYGTTHVGIRVESYGIYQATTSGDVLTLPLDGNYTYTLKTRKYISTEEIKTLTDENYTLSFQKTDNEITFSNGSYTWNGLLDSSNTYLKFNSQKPDNKELYTFTKM